MTHATTMYDSPCPARMTRQRTDSEDRLTDARAPPARISSPTPFLTPHTLNHSLTLHSATITPLFPTYSTADHPNRCIPIYNIIMVYKIILYWI